jgi:predicted amino acid-binding ACT domain protein
MKPFRRTAHTHTHAHGAQPVSWAAELVELAALFMAVGVAHLFVSLIGHHADGATMLVISGAVLIVGAVIHRWWGARSRRSAARNQPHLASTLRDLLEMPGEDRRMWQIRTTLRDRPGSLAALSGKLAALNVNILAIQVHPTKNGVADELLVAAPQGVTVKEMAAAVDAGGGVDIVVAAADTHDLVDPPTRALDLAVRAASDARLLPDALAELLRATAVREPARTNASNVDGETMQLRDHTGAPVILSRPGLPFTAAELARAEALIDLCARLGPRTGARC